MSGPLDIFRLTDGDGQLQRCRSKLRYVDKKAAVSQINRLTRGHHRRGCHKKLEPYPCRVCGGWHLTSNPTRRAQSQPPATKTRPRHRRGSAKA